jgi:hypothetical protein
MCAAIGRCGRSIIALRTSAAQFALPRPDDRQSKAAPPGSGLAARLRMLPSCVLLAIRLRSTRPDGPHGGSHHAAWRPESFSDPGSRVLERISIDKSNPNVMLNEMTTIDAALTRLWTVVNKYGRKPKEKPEWAEENCAEGNGHVVIQG